MEYNDITKRIIGSAIRVHTHLGPGLLESAYKECLCYDLIKNGLTVEKEKPLPIVYERVKLDHGYKIDLLVENKVVVEIKVVEAFTEVHLQQVLTYLRLGHFHLGLLINFDVVSLKNGLKRIVNGVRLTP